MNPKLRRVLLLTMVAIAAGGLWLRGTTHGWSLFRGAAPGAADSAVNAAAPDILRLGSLKLEPCSVGKHAGVPTLRAYCTGLSVPEDRSMPGGRQIQLKIAVLRAAVAQANADAVVFLDGGPGGAATEDFPAIAPAFDALRKAHLVVLVDQRGTGGSNALSCAGAATVRGNTSSALTLQRTRDCLAQVLPHAAPQFYTTTDAVEDLEAVRRALGSPTFDLFGVSYGTRVAQQYARRHPNAVRAIVLDSAVPNDLALGSEHARNLEATLQELFARCRAERACVERYVNPNQTLRRVQAHLKAKPETLELRDPYSFELRRKTITADALAGLVRLYAYSPYTAALLPYVLKEADAGHFAPLLGQAQLAIGDVEEHLNGGMGLSVSCAEDAGQLHANPAAVDTVMGNALVAELVTACSVWPHGQRPQDFGEPLQGRVPVLVLAGEHDPVTPPRYGRAIVRTLPRGRLIEIVGQGHAVLGVGCVPRLMNDFIRTLDAKGLDTHCLDVLAQTPVFVDANGPGP